MTKTALCVALLLGTSLFACGEDATINRDAGVSGEGGVTVDARKLDAAAAVDAPGVVDSGNADAPPASDLASADGKPASSDAAACPALTGVYAAELGGTTCGNFSAMATRQRIDGNVDTCNYRFEFSGTTPAGVSGSFTASTDGSFGPLTLKLGTQDFTCVGTVPMTGVVQLSCGNGACLIKLTRTGPL